MSALCPKRSCILKASNSPSILRRLPGLILQQPFQIAASHLHARPRCYDFLAAAEAKKKSTAHLRPVATLPVAVVAITFVSTRPDAEIATRISAEIPVIRAIMVGTSCGAIARLGTRLTIPPPSVTGVL